MQSEVFGRLLDGAIAFLSRYEKKKVSSLLAELGNHLGVSDASVERYKNEGYIPDTDQVRKLAEVLTWRTPLGREWLRAFLKAARYSETEAAELIARLCPTAPLAPVAPRPRADVPPAEYSSFVMRPEVFAEVVEAMNQDLPVVAIVGLGGNGKSSLAREVALRALVGQDGLAPYAFVTWVSDKARPGSTHLSSVLDSIARRLGYPAYMDLPHEEKRSVIADLLRTHRLLLVVDNADTINDRQLIEWLNQLPAPSKALITTRTRSDTLNAVIVELHGMTDLEAQQLAQQRLRMIGLGYLGHTPHMLAPLITVTKGNPKAITMALGLIKIEGRSLEEITADLAAAHGDLFNDLFDRAWNRLGNSARRLLLAATFFPESASIEALGASASIREQEIHQALRQLTDLSLLDGVREQLSQPPRYVLHPLARAFALSQLHPSEERTMRIRWRDYFHQYIHRHIARPVLGSRYWQTIPVTEMAPLDPERANLLAILEWADREDQHDTLVEFMMLLVHYMERRALYSLREQYARRAVSAASAEGWFADAAIFLIDTLGWLYIEQGRLDDAEQIINEGLLIVERLPVTDEQTHDLQALAATFLGRVALHRHNYTTAQKYSDRALAMTCNPVVRSRVLWFAGEVMFFQRRYAETLTYCQQLDIEVQRYGGEYLRSSAGVVGLVRLAMGEIDQAEQVLRTFMLEISSETAVQRVYAIYGLAFVALARGNQDEALQLANEALEMIRRFRIQHRLETKIKQLQEHIINITVEDPGALDYLIPLLTW